MACLIRTFYAEVLLSLLLFADSHTHEGAGCTTLPDLCRQICVKLAFKTGFCNHGACTCLPVPPLPSRFLEFPRFKDLQRGKEPNDDAKQREVNLFLRRMSFVHRAQPIDVLESVFKNDYFQKMIRHNRKREATERFQPLPNIRRNILARGGVFHMHAEMIPTARYSNEYFSRPSQFGKSSIISTHQKVADIQLEGYKWSLNSYLKNGEKNCLRKTPDTLNNVEKLKIDFEGLSFVAQESKTKPDFRPRSHKIRPTKNKEIAPKSEWFSLNKEDQKVKEEKSRGDMPISKRFVRKSEKEIKNDNNSPPPLKQIVDSLNNIVNNETTGITTNETLKTSDQEQGLSSEASGEPNPEQNPTNGEMSTNNATTQENPDQIQTIGVTKMNEKSEILQSFNQTQIQDQKVSTNETNENNSQTQNPFTDQAYGPVNETSEAEEPDTGLIIKGENLTSDQMSQGEKPITEDANQGGNTTTGEIKQGEEDNGETSQGKEANRETSQGEIESTGETSQGQKESTGEISQGEIGSTGETSQVGKAPSVETSQGGKTPSEETSQVETQPSGEARQGKKLTIRQASQDEKPSTGESNQSEKSVKSDIISQDQNAETSATTSQDQKPGTSLTSQDQNSTTSEINQDQKAETSETSQDQKPGANETSQDLNSTTSEINQDQKPATSETSRDQTPGANETYQDPNSTTSEINQDQKAETSETSQVQKPGDNETSQDQNSTTSEINQGQKSGSSETSQDIKSDTSETSQDKKSDTSETSQDQISEQQTTIIPENEKLYPFLDLPEVPEKPPNVPSENIDQEKIAPRVERDINISSKISESDSRVLEEAELLEKEEPEWTQEEDEKEYEAEEDETLEWMKQKLTETENGNSDNSDKEGGDLYN